MTVATSTYLERPVISFADAKAKRDKRERQKSAMGNYFEARTAFERAPSLLTADLYLVTFVGYVALCDDLDAADQSRAIQSKRQEIDKVLSSRWGMST